MTTPQDLQRIRPIGPGRRRLTGLWGRLRCHVMDAMGLRRDVIHDQDDRHLLPLVHTRRCLIVDAPRGHPELAGRPAAFEGFRLADGNYVGWTMISGRALLLRVTRVEARLWEDASTLIDEPGMLWDARVIGLYDSVMTAHAAADALFAMRG